MASGAFEYRRKVFPANSKIFDEREQGTEAYLVLRGSVEIRKGVYSDNPQTLGTVGKGDLFGEMALFDGGYERSATALAVEETEVVALSREEFLVFWNRMDPLMQRVLTSLIERVRDLGDKLVKKANPYE